jgi:hypothetical protein
MPSGASQPLISRIDSTYDERIITNVSHVLSEVESHKALSFDRDFWRWQYRHLPSKQARVYAILVDGEIKGYYHVPVYEAMVAGNKQALAMVQEVAVSPELRGRGMFRKLAEFATSDLQRSGIEAAYTFPNSRSIHTFLKYNQYCQIGALDTYLLPLRGSDILKSKINLQGIERLIGFPIDYWIQSCRIAKDPQIVICRREEINQEMADVFTSFQKQHCILLLRNHRYLKWRFEQRPQSKHFFFTAFRNNRPVAAAIFKSDRIFGNSALLLMDFACRKGRQSDLLRLIQHVKINGASDIGQDFNLMLASGCSDFLRCLKQIGFLQIPAYLNPRPLNLLVRNLAGSTPEIFKIRNWHITLADWDVM